MKSSFTYLKLIDLEISWRTLQDLFKTRNVVRKMILKNKFKNLSLEGGNVFEFFWFVKKTFIWLVGIGEVVLDEEVVVCVLNSQSL